MMTTAIAGLNSSFMQNPSVMALYLPVASRLAARTGLTLQRLLLPIASAIVMGGALTMVGNSPLILLNDLLVSANNNLPSGLATIEPLRMFAPLPVGLTLLVAGLAYFHFRGNGALAEPGDAVEGNVTPAANPNGSLNSIAGIYSPGFNVLGLMPHPENFVEDLVGGTDGRGLFTSLAVA